MVIKRITISVDNSCISFHKRFQNEIDAKCYIGLLSQLGKVQGYNEGLSLFPNPVPIVMHSCGTRLSIDPSALSREQFAYLRNRHSIRFDIQTVCSERSHSIGEGFASRLDLNLRTDRIFAAQLLAALLLSQQQLLFEELSKVFLERILTISDQIDKCRAIVEFMLTALSTPTLTAPRPTFLEPLKTRLYLKYFKLYRSDLNKAIDNSTFVNGETLDHWLTTLAATWKTYLSAPGLDLKQWLDSIIKQMTLPWSDLESFVKLHDQQVLDMISFYPGLLDEVKKAGVIEAFLLYSEVSQSFPPQVYRHLEHLSTEDIKLFVKQLSSEAYRNLSLLLSGEVYEENIRTWFGSNYNEKTLQRNEALLKNIVTFQKLYEIFKDSGKTLHDPDLPLFQRCLHSELVRTSLFDNKLPLDITEVKSLLHNGNKLPAHVL